MKKEAGHRPFKDIADDINRINRERGKLKLTINESLAKRLGLYEVAELDAAAPDLSDSFRLVGCEYVPKKYIRLSKNKNEFKIEQMDGDELSHLLLFFANCWKEHIFYLNNEENRLLMELRDALLPELMSGRIEV